MDNFDFWTPALTLVEHDLHLHDHRDGKYARALLDSAPHVVRCGDGTRRWAQSRPVEALQSLQIRIGNAYSFLLDVHLCYSFIYLTLFKTSSTSRINALTSAVIKAQKIQGEE